MASDRSADSEMGDPKTVTIVRYPNRRLYDRSQGRYVTLQDVEETIRRGFNVTVRDSKSGEDLTRSVLAQIILERHPERMELIPISFLHTIIQANEAMLGTLRENVRKSLAYLDLVQRAAAFNPLAVPGAFMQAFFPGLSSQERAASASPAGPDAAALAVRVAELERRLEEVQGKGGEGAGAQKKKR